MTLYCVECFDALIEYPVEPQPYPGPTGKWANEAVAVYEGLSRCYYHLFKAMGWIEKALEMREPWMLEHPIRVRYL